MTPPFIDTDVIIRFLTGDDPDKQARAAALFEQVEKRRLKVVAPVTVIADCVYVLSSPRLYHLPRTLVAGLLTPLLRLPNFKISNRRTIQKALALYLFTNLDFGDAFIVASMQPVGSQTVYSYDTDFDRVKGIKRLAP